MLSNFWNVLSQRNRRPRLLHFFSYVIEVMRWKMIKHAFSLCYTLIKHGFFYQLECVQGSLNIISGTKGDVKVFQFNFERFLSASDLIKDSLCNVYHGLDWAGWVNTAHSQNQSHCRISTHKLRKKIYNWYYFFFSFLFSCSLII